MATQNEWQLKRERVIDPADIAKKLLPAARLHPDPLIWFLIYLLSNTGARISEALALRAGDLSERDSCLLVKTLKRKSSHVRQLFLQPEVVHEVRQWIVTRGLKDDDLLFESPRHPGRPLTRQWVATLFDRVAIAAGIKIFRSAAGNGVSFHGLRHAHAVALMQGARHDKTMGPLDALQLVKTRLGHSNLKSTLVYLHVVGEKEVISRMTPIGAPSPLRALPGPKAGPRRVASRVRDVEALPAPGRDAGA